MTDYKPEIDDQLIRLEQTGSAAITQKARELIGSDFLSPERINFIIGIMEEGLGLTPEETQITLRQGTDGTQEEVLTIRDQAPATADPRVATSALGATASKVLERFGGDINFSSRHSDEDSEAHEEQVDEHDAWLDELVAMEEEISPLMPTINYRQPSRLRLALRRNKHMFKSDYFEDPGNCFRRRDILLGKVPYVGSVDHMRRIPFKERHWYQEKKEKYVRRAVGFAVGMLAVASVGSLITADGQESTENLKAQTPVTVLETPTSIQAPSTVSNPFEQANFTPEQVANFNRMVNNPEDFMRLVRWVEENPDKDFVTEFQKAEALGYFDS